MTSRSGLNLKWTTLIVLVILIVTATTPMISGHQTTTTVSASESGLAGGARTQAPSSGVRTPRHRHGHGVNGQARVSPRTIARPAECCLNDLIFNDCFLCGKVTEDLQTYQNCCQRDTDTVTFCGRLLTRRR